LGSNLTADLNQSIIKANELRLILERSTKSNGMLDLGAFNKELN
jgi:hypothetical protein